MARMMCRMVARMIPLGSSDDFVVNLSFFYNKPSPLWVFGTFMVVLTNV